MRHIPLCLFVPFVLACGIVEPVGPFIRVEGTVTAANDGTPVAGAEVRVWVFCLGSDCTPPAQDTTDTAGDYSLAFVAVNCQSGGTWPGNIFVTHPDFQFENIGLFSDLHMTCTEELQTIDIQLDRFSHTARL